MASRYKFTREMVEDLKWCPKKSLSQRYSDAAAKADIEKMNWMRKYAEAHNVPYIDLREKEIKRVYSELDPYGEENWED